GTFDTDDVTMLEALASQGATLIERATLYEQLREAFTGTIEALAAALDSRDPYTHGHTRRVSKYSVNIGIWMGLSSQPVFDLRLAALLHDIGKVGIPDNILKKPGSLTKEEFLVMTTHTLEGYKILKPVKLSQDILGGVLHHHEKWDGTGYPHGLKGSAIPLFGRIIGVADTYDAMTSDRPYRKALSAQVALQEIVKNKEKQFDPAVADVFIEHFDQIIL
ncbi:MAG: HD domain-containing phosphohydrolase, partial [Methylocella sp.]